MSKVKYYYDTKTLSYKKIEVGSGEKARKVALYLASTIALALAMMVAFYNLFDSPKEKQLRREMENLSLKYEVFNRHVVQLETVLDDMADRDNNIYRVVFGADSIPLSIRKAGFGGINRYKNMEGFENSDLIVSTAQRLDQVAKQMYVQSKSYDEIVALAEKKTEMLSSIPAIQPVANKDLKRMASGYGWRIHPIYKTRKFHYGMDFSAPQGTEVYATGDGVISKVKKSKRGLGYHIEVDHDFGYETVYAHLSGFKVRKGQKVTRGQVIGLVGSTGNSTAPHLHYEVHKNRRKINPLYYYYNDFSDEEYDLMIELASRVNQSFD
ncbi:MAG: murein DD-endopeptidase MepM/ murein hydrolase activator NlpD [Flavobacteriales bacterium]|jgi:murein DD-endopeptidase MepM/ murein hydrolase activator NlpD